jgi:hypothetical protein
VTNLTYHIALMVMEHSTTNGRSQEAETKSKLTLMTSSTFSNALPSGLTRQAERLMKQSSGSIAVHRD